MNNRYGGKDARRINLIAQKANHQATKLQQKDAKRTALHKARLAEVALKKNIHQLQMKNSLVTYSSLSWESNLSDVE